MAEPRGYGVVAVAGRGHPFREREADGGEDVQRVSVVEAGAGYAGEAEGEGRVGGEGVGEWWQAGGKARRLARVVGNMRCVGVGGGRRPRRRTWTDYCGLVSE